VKKKGQRPSTKQVLNEARTTMPPPALLQERVQKVPGHFVCLDSVSNAALSNGEDSSKWPQFFEPMMPAIRHAVNRRMHHVDKGCLSDPVGVDMHVANATAGKHCILRGTSLNETVNKCSSVLLGNSIGIDQVDRLLNSFFEVWNHRLLTQRLGSQDHGTARTKVLALLNSLARSAGHLNEDLPFPTLSKPAVLPNRFKETMGLDFDPEHSDVSNPADAGHKDGEPCDEDTACELQELLQNVDWDNLEDEEDEHHEPEEEPLFDDDPVDLIIGEDKNEEEANHGIDDEVEQLHLPVPDTKAPETSMQSFDRLTNEQAWVPFGPTKASTPKARSDLAEEALSNRMSKDCERHVSPGTPRHGHKDFELAWNIEVAEQHRIKTEDDNNDTVLINRKSHMQLRQHCDDMVQSDRLSKICDPNCTQLQQLNQTMRDTRQFVAAPTGRAAEAVVCQDSGNPAPFGAPAAFNPSITRHAAIGTTDRPQVAWRLGVPPPIREENNVLTNFKKATWCVSC